MRKSDLYKFLNTKTDDKKAPLQAMIDEIEATVRVQLANDIQDAYPTFQFEVGKMLALATRMKNTYSENTYKDKDYYKVLDNIRDGHYLMEVQSNLVSHAYYSKIQFYLAHKEGLFGEILALYPKTAKYIDEVHEEYLKASSSIDSINTLYSELYAVIKSSSTVKKAIETLESLGMDMKDLTVVVDTKLPAVVKLSEDINILN